MSACYWLNTAWMLTARREARIFTRSCSRVDRVQHDLLQSILENNRNSLFGRRHQFGSVNSIDEFRDRVPISSHGDYVGDIRRIANGEPGILTSDRIRLLEPTGGSDSGEKLIPYNRELHRQFQRAIRTWIADLFLNRPGVRSGRAFWSLSPCIPRRTTRGGLPIGFEDDTAYLGQLGRRLVRKTLAVPTSLSRVEDLDVFRYLLLLHLLGTADLSLISVWSPTYLSVLLKTLEHCSQQIVHDLRHSPLSLTSQGLPVPADVLPKISAKRTAEVVRILDAGLPMEETTSQLWPRLDLVSCWCDGSSHRYVEPLRHLFPGIEIQPKGLVATEGFVSIPRHGFAAPHLAFRSHFFEFLDCDRNTEHQQQTCLAHELQAGRNYEVLLTTGGGLYRYRLGDVVQVVDHDGLCPLLRFSGRQGQISDQVGEKLVEQHVNTVLQEALQATNTRVTFSILCLADSTPPGYCLFLQDKNSLETKTTTQAIRRTVEDGLGRNPYYRHAVRFGQLAPLTVCWLAPDGQPGWSIYEQVCRGRGQQWGNIKPRTLDPDRDLFRALYTSLPAAQESRRAELGHCRHCGRTLAPENKHGGICHGCAERHEGIVH